MNEKTKLYNEMSKTITFHRLDDVDTFGTFARLLTSYVEDEFVDLDHLSDLTNLADEVGKGEWGEHEELFNRIATMYNGEAQSTSDVVRMIFELDFATYQYPDHCFEIQFG